MITNEGPMDIFRKLGSDELLLIAGIVLAAWTTASAIR